MSDLERAREILRDRSQRIALVGASRASHKYGHIILRFLGARGYTVVPVNPHETSIEGIGVVSSLDDVAPPVGIINVVVPPETALQVLEELAEPPGDLIWFQPGAYDSRVLELARERFPSVIAGDCILVVARLIEAEGRRERRDHGPGAA